MTARPLLGSPTRTSDAIVEALSEGGVTEVFGIPGGYMTTSIFRSLVGSQVRTIHARSEAVAALMAEAAARLRGAPSVLLGQGAWLLTGGGQAILEASLGSTPLVVLADFTDHGPFTHHASYQSGFGDRGGWDAQAAFRGIAKEVKVALDPVQAVQQTQLALKHATAGCPGPIVVLFHSNALRGEVGPGSRPALVRSTGLRSALPRASTDDVRALRAMVDDSSSPIILAGNGVRAGRAQAELLRAAEVLDLPVVTTSSGKGTFPEDHPSSGGSVGSYGAPQANLLLRGADLVIVVGSRLGATDLLNEDPDLLDTRAQAVVQIDVEAAHVGWTTPVDLAIVGDAGALLSELAEQSGPPQRPSPSAADRVVMAAAQARAGSLFEAPPSDGTILPEALIGSLERALPAQAVLTADAGENRLYLNRFFRVRRGLELLQPSGIGGMGYALPAALGAKLVSPDTACVAVCGDGGLSMSLAAMMTAVERGLDIKVLVLDNGLLGYSHHSQGSVPNATVLDPFDHAAIARSFGWAGRAVDDVAELDAGLRWLLDEPGPALLNVGVAARPTWKEIAAGALVDRSPAPSD